MTEKPPSPLSIPEQRVESIERKEFFKASLGFDFVFYRDRTGKKRCACIEINGAASGIGGMEDIPEGEITNIEREQAAERNLRNPEFLRKGEIMVDIEKSLQEHPSRDSEEEKQKVRSYMTSIIKDTPQFKNAFRNPDFIETLANNKERQISLIPEEFRPRTWREGTSPISATGYWICKPIHGRAGNNIKVFSNSEFPSYFIGLPKGAREGYVAQELLQSDGADRAPKELSGNPSSMRLLMDFRYLEDESIEKIYSAAYQRIAPFNPERTIEKGEDLPTIEEISIVNRARGAKSAAVSNEELQLAEPIAEKIIRNIAEQYRLSLGTEERLKELMKISLQELESELAFPKSIPQEMVLLNKK